MRWKNHRDSFFLQLTRSGQFYIILIGTWLWLAVHALAKEMVLRFLSAKCFFWGRRGEGEGNISAVGIIPATRTSLLDKNLQTCRLLQQTCWVCCTCQGLTGATTVSSTMIAANTTGIPVFVTGGIGGVHRGAQSSKTLHLKTNKNHKVFKCKLRHILLDI